MRRESGNAFPCIDCSLSETLYLTCACRIGPGLAARETSLNLAAPFNSSGVTGPGAFTTSSGQLNCVSA
jgi:hypothetical protein